MVTLLVAKHLRPDRENGKEKFKGKPLPSFIGTGGEGMGKSGKGKCPRGKVKESAWGKSTLQVLIHHFYGGETLKAMLKNVDFGPLIPIIPHLQCH